MSNMTLRNAVALIDIQARMKMRAQASKLLLSYLWWFIEPLLLVVVFYTVFEFILKRGGDNYFVFLIVGKIVFIWFSKGITLGSQSLIQNRGIIGQKPMPKWIFPLVNVQEATYKSLVGIALLMIVLYMTGYSEPSYWWQLIPLFTITYLLISGISFILSILVAFAEDFSQLIALAILGLMFGSGIFWDINTIENQSVVNMIFLFNPLAALVDAYRTVLINNSYVNYSNLESAVVISIFLWFIGIFLLKKMNNKLTRFILS